MIKNGGGERPTAIMKVVMMLAWISVHDHVAGGKLRELAKDIGCSQKEALGILVSLWLWGLNNADRTGRLRSCDRYDIAEEVSSKGRSDGLDKYGSVESLIAHRWIDEGEDGTLYLHDWDTWQEQWYRFLKMKEYDAERKRQERARKKAETEAKANYEGGEEAKESSENSPKDCPQDNPKDNTENTPKSEDCTEKPKHPYKEIIAYLNQKTGKNFRWQGEATKKHINARFREGFKLEDFYAVIDAKTNEWKNDSKMQKFLRPETLFGNKFEGYLNQIPHRTIKADEQARQDAGNPFEQWKGD